MTACESYGFLTQTICIYNWPQFGPSESTFPPLHRMASHSVGAPPATHPLPPQLTHRPLQREGAVILLSAAERAIEDAMMRSSSPPVEDPAPRKRAREGEDPEDTELDEPGEDPPSPLAATQSQGPSLSNVIAATRRYASRKKLRPEQRDEVEAFLSVSSLAYHFLAGFSLMPRSGCCNWSAGQIIYMHLAGE